MVAKAVNVISVAKAGGLMTITASSTLMVARLAKFWAMQILERK